MKFMLAVGLEALDSGTQKCFKKHVGMTSVGESGGKIAGFQASEPYVYTSSKIALPSDRLLFFPGRARSSENNFDFDASKVGCCHYVLGF